MLHLVRETDLATQGKQHRGSSWPSPITSYPFFHFPSISEANPEVFCTHSRRHVKCTGPRLELLQALALAWSRQDAHSPSGPLILGCFRIHLSVPPLDKAQSLWKAANNCWVVCNS